jgi:hypothetical protein
LRGFERRERLVKDGRVVRWEKEERVSKALELTVRSLSRGVCRGAVMVLMLFEEAEMDVREGK